MKTSMDDDVGIKNFGICGYILWASKITDVTVDSLTLCTDWLSVPLLFHCITV